MAKQLLLPKKVAKKNGISKAAGAHHNAGMSKMAKSSPVVQSVSMTPPPNNKGHKADITQTIKSAVKKHAGSKKNMSLPGIKKNPKA